MVKVPPDRLLGSRCRLLSLRAAQCALYAHAPGMDEPLHDVRCNMGHEGVLRLGATPPPHAIRCPIRRLRGNADAASFYSVPTPHKRRKAPAHSTSDFGCGFRVETGTAQKTEASRAHRPLARSLSLSRVAQGRHERMTTPHAALAPQYNKSQEGQLSRLYFNGLWQIQPRATSPLMEYGEFDRTDQPVDGLQ